jgi:hypothetical protein
MARSTLKAEILDRQQRADLACVEATVTTYAGHYNYQQLHGELDSQTPAERLTTRPSQTAASPACRWSASLIFQPRNVT